MQTGTLFHEGAWYNKDFPSEESEVIPGVPWGYIAAFPTPAYWAYQAWAYGIIQDGFTYKIGESLREEVGACLLGGHGIPARVGMAAFYHMKAKGAFESDVPSEAVLFGWLSEPLQLEPKPVKYRFARQKARYLHQAMKQLEDGVAPEASGRALRDWLLQAPGIGYKTASWIARNWLDADDVAILDIHILRAGELAGFFAPGLTVERHYLELEAQFIAFADALGVRPAVLDSLIWRQMVSAGSAVHRLLEHQRQNS